MITDYLTRQQTTARRQTMAVRFVQPYERYHAGDVASFTPATAQQYLRLGVAVDVNTPPAPAPAAPPRQRTSRDVIAAARARGDWGRAPKPERDDA